MLLILPPNENDANLKVEDKGEAIHHLQYRKCVFLVDF
jgi:hypothetical protein